MKTPRELILERHRAVEPKLAAIRAEDLAVAARSSRSYDARLAQVSWLSSLAGGFWREAILPWRRAWAGMALGWLVILTVNFSVGGVTMIPADKTQQPSAEVLAALRQQRRLMALLLEPLPTEAATPAEIPGKRSERKQATATA